MSQETELKTTDVGAAKRFIVKNDQKQGYRLQCSFGTFHPTIYTQIPFPNRKALLEALDEIDGKNLPDSYSYHHLPHEERMKICDFIHDSNLRATICTFKVSISPYHGRITVGIDVESNPVWDAMKSQWHRERKDAREAKEAADAETKEEE